MSTPFTSPTGRKLFGDAFTAVPIIDDLTKKPKIDPATNQPLMEYIVGVGYAKNDPLWPAFLETLKAADRAAYPQFHGPDGNLLPGVKFADKITDGDGFNSKGVSYASRDGWAGHWIVRYGTRYAPTCHQHDGTKWVQLTDPKSIPDGYYVQIAGTTKSNDSQQSPGMYRNLNMVALVGQGPIIVKGQSADDAFGAPPATLPPGATPAPVSATAIPFAGPAPVAPAVPVAQPVPVSPPPTSPPPPYDGYMAAPPAPAPGAPASPPPPPASAAPVYDPQAYMTAAATTTYAAYVAAGWTTAQLITNGFMVDHVPY